MMLAFLLAAAIQTPNQWVDPPGEETPAVAAILDEAIGRLGKGTSANEILPEPRYMPYHAYPRFREAVRTHAPTGELRIADRREPGTPLQVEMTVRRDGAPVPGVLLYVYHTSAKGWYSDRAAHIRAEGGDHKYARLFGYVRSDAMGKIRIESVRPEGYPRSDLPAHIHYFAERDGHPAGGGEIRFDDDPRLTSEWRRRSEAERAEIVSITRLADGSQRIVATVELR